MTPQGLSLYFVVTVSLIFGEDDPCPFCDVREPLFVTSATREEVPVTAVLHTTRQQYVEDWLAVVEIFIQIKNEIVKLQLLGFPSGLPLRSAFLRGHIPWLVRVQIRER